MYVTVRQSWSLASKIRSHVEEGNSKAAEHDVDDRFAQELQQARLKARACLLEVSEQTGIDVATIASWERDEDQPSGHVRSAVLDVLRQQAEKQRRVQKKVVGGR